MTMTELRLLPELIPEPLWGLTVANRLGTRSIEWRSIRAAVLAEANNTCGACGTWVEGGRYHVCNEVWAYDEAHGVATLTGFRIRCQPCDRARHFGLSQLMGREPAWIQLAKVNKTTEAEAQSLMARAYREWRRLSRLTWTVAVDPALAARFPAVTVVVGEVGRPGEGQARMQRR